MPKVAAKVAMSIPNDLYRAVEQARKKSGKSRSAVMQDALRHWLRQQEQAVLIRAYEAGYRSKPEGKREVKAAEAAAKAFPSSTTPLKTVTDPFFGFRQSTQHPSRRKLMAPKSKLFGSSGFCVGTELQNVPRPCFARERGKKHPHDFRKSPFL